MHLEDPETVTGAVASLVSDSIRHVWILDRRVRGDVRWHPSGESLTTTASENNAMTRKDEQLVTGEFLGFFLMFGADIILAAVLLAVAGIVSGPVAVGVTALVLGVYGVWLGLRWRRLRDSEEPTEPDPLETLRDRYAAGELSDEEFERRLDRLLDAEREERASVDERSKERSRE